MLPAFGAVAPLEDFALETEDLGFDPEGLLLEDAEDRARDADDFVFDPEDFARDPELPLLRACDPFELRLLVLRLLVLRLLARDEPFLLVELLPELRPAEPLLEDFVDCAILSPLSFASLRCRLHPATRIESGKTPASSPPVPQGLRSFSRATGRRRSGSRIGSIASAAAPSSA